MSGNYFTIGSPSGEARQKLIAKLKAAGVDFQERGQDGTPIHVHVKDKNKAMRVAF